MNFLTESIHFSIVGEALGMTILHSLGHGFALMFLLAIFLRLGKSLSSGTRFIVAFASLLIFLVAFAITFYQQWESRNPAPVIALPIERSTEDVVINPSKLESIPAEQVIKVETSQWEVWRTQLSRLAPWLAWLWAVGSFVFALRLINGLVQSQRLRYRTQPIPVNWQQRAEKLIRQLGISQPVSIASSNRSSAPLTLGWLKPIVLIPTSLLVMMPADQLEAIIIHELAHIKRRDYLWNLIQSVAEVVLFYHPAYWYMASVLEHERELACDALTVTVTQQPRVYAQALLQVAAQSAQVPLPSVAASGKRGLSNRIQQIIYPGKVQRSISVLPFLLLLSMISLSLAAFSWYQPDFNNPEDNLPPPDFIGYGQRYSFAVTLPNELATYSQEDYLIGQNDFTQKISSPWRYFKESTVYLLNGEVVDDPESIRMDAIQRYEVYYAPLPASLQNLAKKEYSAVVQAFSREYEQSNPRSFGTSGQITTRIKGKIQPVPGIKIEVKETGQQALTDDVGKFQLPAAPEETLIFHLPEQTPMELAIDGREFFHIVTHIPSPPTKRYQHLQERLIQRMSETALEKDREAIQQKINTLDKAINSLSPNSESVVTDSVELSKFRPLDPTNQPPLFVINGVVQTNEKSIDALDPDNITSIETMKSDEAQIWFGKQAMGGAVLIRTKDAPPPKIIKGTVFSGDTKLPLSNVKVSIDGKNLTESDGKGNYSVHIPNYSSKIILSKDGYETIRPISDGYPSWPAKLYMRPVPSAEEIASFYQKYLVQQVPRTAYSVNNALYTQGTPFPKLRLEDIQSIRVIESKNMPEHLREKFDRIVSISTQDAYQYTYPSLSSVNALYVIDGVPHKSRTDLSDISSEDIVSTEIVRIKDNRADQFEGLPIEGKEHVIFVTTKADLTPKTISGRIIEERSREGIAGVKIRATNGSTAETDSEGYYQIQLPANTQKTTFEFTHPDYPKGKIEAKIIGEKLNDLLFIKPEHYQEQRDSIAQIPEADPVEFSQLQQLDSALHPPLYIIDGVFVDDPLENLDPRSIMNIDVVKSPEAEKRYGKKVIGGAVLITMKNPSSTKTIKGKVTSEKTGEPLPGINIIVEGTNIGTVTDPQGNYSIKVDNPNARLNFQFLGYRDEIREVRGQSSIKVGMIELSDEELKIQQTEMKRKQLKSSAELNSKVPLKVPTRTKQELAEILRFFDSLRIQRGSNSIRMLTGAPTQFLTGHVLDYKTGNPLPGVNVVAEGKTTVTDQNGLYYLTFSKRPKTGKISFTFPGYKAREIEAFNYHDYVGIALTKKETANLISEPNTALQQIIEGTVTAAEGGEPLPGVNVIVEGTNIGTVTDRGGKYSIQVPQGASNLVFSSASSEQKTVSIKGKRIVNVELTFLSLDDPEHTLFVIDGQIREDINTLDDLEDIHYYEIQQETPKSSLPPEYRNKGYTKMVKVVTKDFQAYLEDRTVLGKLIDAESEKPLVGAEITWVRKEGNIVLGRTNEQGEYEVKLPKEAKIIGYFHSGYAPHLLPDRFVTESFPMRLTLALEKNQIDKAAFENKLKVYPNPGSQEIRIEFTLEKAANIDFRLYSREGRLVHDFKSLYLLAGEQNVSLPTIQFPSNEYLLVIKINDGLLSFTRRVGCSGMRKYVNLPG